MTIALIAVCVLTSRGSAAIPSQVAKLLAIDGDIQDHFGILVDMSGNTIIVGAPDDDDNGVNSGSAYIFILDSLGVWTQQAKLLFTGGATVDQFGFSVAIAGDTAVIGMPGDDVNGVDAGAAVVYVRDAAGVWTQQAKLLAADGAANDRFGISVAISGNTAVVGAFFDDDNGPNSGSSFVFVRDATGVWTQEAKLLAADGFFGDRFGASVAISDNTAIVGSYFHSHSAAGAGAAYVFVRNATQVWTQQGELLATDGAANDGFGFSVAISGDAAITGALLDDDNGTSSGSAYVFGRDAAGIWTQTAKLLAADGAVSDTFGSSVSISGARAVVGARQASGNILGSGSAYFFVRDVAGFWTQHAELSANDGAAGDAFGVSTSISGDMVCVGAFWDDDNGVDSGSSYVFDLGQICAVDFNGDGIVNAADLASLLGAWGTAGSADLDGNGVVDAADLAGLLANWGPCP